LLRWIRSSYNFVKFCDSTAGVMAAPKGAAGNDRERDVKKLVLLTCQAQFLAVKNCGKSATAADRQDCRDASRELAVCATTRLCTREAKAVAEECTGIARERPAVSCLDARQRLKSCLQYYGLPYTDDLRNTRSEEKRGR